MQKIKSCLFILFQYLVPQHLLSRTIGLLADNQTPFIKNFLITQAIKVFNIDMTLAEEKNINNYPSFNEFFIRKIDSSKRPIAEGSASIVSPADGEVSQIGSLTGEQMIQAKGKQYALSTLLANDEKYTKAFADGQFATIYLSPKDYHRVHMPADGKLVSMTHVPGQLYSVNHKTADHIPEIFAKNERVIAYFETDFGPMAMILVGAMIVASIETTWAGLVTPIKKNHPRHWSYTSSSSQIKLAKGEEMGRFKMGSTVIVLFPKDSMHWEPTLEHGSELIFGQKMGEINSK